MQPVRFGALYNLATYRLCPRQGGSPGPEQPFAPDTPLLKLLQSPHTEDVLAFTCDNQAWLVDDRPDNLMGKGHKTRFKEELAELQDFMDHLQLKPERRPGIIEIFKQHFVDSVYFLAIKPTRADIEADPQNRPQTVHIHPEDLPSFQVTLKTH